MQIKALVSSLFALAAVAHAATVGGRCAGNGFPDGICISTSSCAGYGGTSYPGFPGAYTCPGTPDDVQCCTIIPNCPNHAGDTLCTWSGLCVGDRWTGVILDDPVCPGGSDFVCCDIDG